MASEKHHVTAVICGGGNGAHLMAGIAASQPNVEARVLTLYADEAQRWSESLPAEGITVQDICGKEEKLFSGRYDHIDTRGGVLKGYAR